MRTDPTLLSTQLYVAAKMGTLSDVPAEVLTEGALTTVDKDKGYAPIHVAAMFGHLNQIPKDRLTPAVMLAPSQDKLNALHYAACERHLHQVPKRLLTPELLGDTTHTDWTPAHEIAASGDIGLVPEASLTKDVLIKSAAPREFSEATPRLLMSVIEICVRNGSVAAIPRSALTPEVMNANTCSGEATAMHVVAETGCWDSVPAELVTTETSSLRDGLNETPLHYAAKEGKLREVPVKLLTPDSVMQPSGWGDTPLHRAASWGHISQMPADLLTRENLSVPHRSTGGLPVGKTSYHYAARSGTLGDLPPHTLERFDLLRGDSTGMMPLHDAAMARRLARVPKGIVLVDDLSAIDESGRSVEGLACVFDCRDQLLDPFHDHPISPSLLLHHLPADPQASLATSASKPIEQAVSIGSA